MRFLADYTDRILPRILGVAVPLQSIGISLISAKSVAPNVKLFVGGRFIYVNTEYVLKAAGESVNMKKRFTTGGFLLGYSNIFTESDWETSATFGTDFTSRFFFTYSVANQYVTFGLSVQPLTIFTIAPFLRIRIAI